MKEITEKTLMPISMLIFVAGIIFWAAKIDQSVKAQETRVSSVELKQDKIFENIAAIRIDLAVVKKIIEEKHR